MEKISLSGFADKFAEIIPVITREFARHLVGGLYKDRITISQLLVLEQLHNRAESKMKDLADFMNVTTAAMTGIIDRLVREGCVTRIFDPNDRRIIRVKLTSKGNKFLQRINLKRRQTLIKIFEKVSDNDRAEYLRILLRIHNILLEDNFKAK